MSVGGAGTVQRRSAVLAHLHLLTEAALICFEGDATAAQTWLEAPHVSLGGLAPMEATFSSVLTVEAIRLLPWRFEPAVVLSGAS